jgi:hypothetical protein
MSSKASKELIQEVMQLAQAGLVERGYKKRTGQIFTLELSTGFLGWLGLNRAVNRGDGSMAVNPVVGVRFQELERTLEAIMDEGPQAYVVPTISINIGYLTPENSHKTWVFSESAHNHKTVSDMLAAVEKYGRPFMISMADMRSIQNAFEAKEYSLPENRKYHLPLIYHLRGEDDRTRAELQKNLTEIGEREDLAAQRYRQFAKRLKAQLE